MTLVHQILAIFLLMLIAAAFFTVSAAELLPAGGGGRGEDRFEAPRTGRGGGERTTRDVDRDPAPILMFFLAVLLLIEAAYTYLHYSLYSVGQDAAARGADVR